MTTRHQPDLDDDALAEALADAWVEKAMQDPVMRKLALRAAGLAKAPAEMTREELAREHGTSLRSLRRTEADALFKLRNHPATLSTLRALFPSKS